MSKLYSKLYRKEDELEFIAYKPSYNYLKFVDECRNQGYIQIILHSRLILDICEKLIANNHFIREVSIDENSFIEVDDLKLSNISSKDELGLIKEELAFNDDNYIEIKEVKIESTQKNYIFDLRSNGILSVTSDDNSQVILQLKKILYEIFGS